MNLNTVFEQFPTQESCIAHLEAVRWDNQPRCPHCSSVRVARKTDGRRVGRWNCHCCKSSFNVLSGTIFQGTKIPLQKWFLAIAILIDAPKSVSSHQLAAPSISIRKRLGTSICGSERLWETMKYG